jgi:hypothetical protein
MNLSARPADADTQGLDAIEDFTRSLIADLAAFPDLSLQAAYSLSREQRDRIALEGLRRRFGELRRQDQLRRRCGRTAIEYRYTACQNDTNYHDPIIPGPGRIAE